MLQWQALQILILFVTIIHCVSTFELFIHQLQDDQIEHLLPFRNKSYEISLFRRCYITVQVHPNELRRNEQDNSNMIGFKFQIKSTNPDSITVEKVIQMPTETADTSDSNEILLEDLYILPDRNTLNHIFNAYPSPTLIYLDQSSTDNLIINTTWSVDGTSMSVTNLTIRLDVFYDDDTSVQYLRSLHILVTQPKRRVDTIFYIIIPFMVITISILMGILLDTRLIAGILQKPAPIIIGFIAQYGLMPFLAMAIAKIFRFTPLNSLALFVIGCCPGSGASNQWTILFDGDVNLSALMSFVSTAASFFMMPLYFYTFGTFYMKELSITVPFLGLARSLATVVIPYSIGICISHFAPKSRPFVEKLVKPMMICLMIFFLTFGLIVNWYLFKMIDLYTVLTAPLLPYLGFLFGGVLAWISRMSWIHIKTISIEAGIQNTGIAFMIIIYSLPQPYATQALIIPMVVSFMTTKPFWIILIIRNRIIKYRKRKELITTNEKESLDAKETLVESMQIL